MLTIKRILEEEGNCLFCNKSKEVALVALDGQGEMLLCWADLKKMAKMRMRMNGKPDPRVPAASQSLGQTSVLPK